MQPKNAFLSRSMRVHEAMWFKLARDKVAELERQAATERMVREARGPLAITLRRRLARGLRTAARRLSHEVERVEACSAPGGARLYEVHHQSV
jgi:hypothetical protein